MQVVHLTNDDKQFYPTPWELAAKMLEGVEFEAIETVLEPSAGKGNLAAACAEKYKRARRGYGAKEKLDIDCIEIDRNLQHILRGEGFRVVHDDFLTFAGRKKYDLIVMNPPFASGAEHLLKALELQKDGGRIVCLLNKQTLLNPHTNARKLLLQQLNQLAADDAEAVKIEHIDDAFASAERNADVDVAIVRVTIPQKERTSSFFEGLRKAREESAAKEQEATEITVADTIQALIDMYNHEVAGTLALIDEYHAMRPYMLTDFDGSNNGILTLALRSNGERYGYDTYHQFVDKNAYLKLVRRKYWSKLLEGKQFLQALTTNMREEYRGKLEELKDYDFTMYNIKTVQLDINKNIVRGVEESIVEVFDKLSAAHSFHPETQGNIHYYNGWATNKAHKINKKVIIPTWGLFSDASWSRYAFSESRAYEVLTDIEKAFNYLSVGGEVPPDIDLSHTLRTAAECGDTKNIWLKYFTVTLYKKGTCHITFRDLELLEKMNIYGSMKKKWLPPSYGKKRYADMDAEDKAVVDDFQGEKAYEKTLDRAEFYLYDPAQSGLMLLTGG